MVRPLAGRPLTLTTYLLRLGGRPSEPLSRVIERAKRAYLSVETLTDTGVTSITDDFYEIKLTSTVWRIRQYREER